MYSCVCYCVVLVRKRAVSYRVNNAKHVRASALCVSSVVCVYGFAIKLRLRGLLVTTITNYYIGVPVLAVIVGSIFAFIV